MTALAHVATNLANEQPVITTDRLELRPLRRSDVGLIAHYTADRRVAEGTRAIPHPLPPGAAEAFVNRAMDQARTEDVWAIDGSAHGLGEVLGVVSLTRLEDDRSELGFWVGAGFWNTGSARVLTNCGFAYLGDAESWSVARNSRVPTWTYLRRMTA